MTPDDAPRPDRARAARRAALRARLGVFPALAAIAAAAAVLASAGAPLAQSPPTIRDAPPSSPQRRPSPSAPLSPAAPTPDAPPVFAPELGFGARARGGCLAPGAEEGALSVALVSSAPSPLCEPTLHVVELRNASPTALGDARLSLSAPTGASEMRFSPLRPAAAGAPERFVEISTDKGATWRRASAPRGAGDAESPFLWSRDEVEALSRLGPAGAPDDSVLLRWRAALGEEFGSTFASEARLWLSASAADACGVRAHAPQTAAELTVLRPSLEAGIEGRNVTRGGAFGRFVHAAPGDEVEWRVRLRNEGAANANHARARVTAEGAAAGALTARRPAEGDGGDVFAVGAVVSGGARTRVLRETVGAACGRRRVFAAASWGCAAPAPGAPGALGDLLARPAQATLVTEPSPEQIGLEQKWRSLDGVERPGDVIEIRYVVRHRGAPIFDPIIAARLPDGYVFDPGQPAVLFAPTQDVAGVTVDATAPEAPLFRLLGRAGDLAALSEGERLELRYRAVRARRSEGESGALAATLRYRDGCGSEGATATLRETVRPRQSRLQVTLTPEDGPIVSGPGDEKTFALEVSNAGDAAARDVEAEIALEAGWTATPPPGCVAAPGAPDRLRCAISDLVAPEDRATTRLRLSVAEAAAAGAGLGVVATARAQARSDGGRADGPLDAATARSGAIGFSLTQRVLRADGAPHPLDEPIDLGETVSLEVDARWFGGGAETVTGASILQNLPPELAFVRASPVGDGPEVAAALTPRAGRSGQALWSLAPFTGDARFVGRITAEAREAPPEPDDAAAASEDGAGAPRPSGDAGDRAVVVADATFELRGDAIGVDPLVDDDSAAAPISLRFRRPEVRLTMARADLAPGAPAVSPITLNAGERALLQVEAENVGAAPGFLQWVRLAASEPLAIEPPGADGLDNDGDGAVDEPDEAATRISAADGSAVSWTALPGADVAGGATVGGMRRRLDPGRRVAWLTAVRAGEQAVPGVEVALELDGRFGSTPSALDRAGAETRSPGPARARIRGVAGGLALTGTSFGGDIGDTVAHGERVELRIALALPPGILREAVLEVDAPPSLGALEDVRHRFGPGVTCARADAAPAAEPAESGATRYRWRFGDCAVALDAPLGARRAFVDFAAIVADADPLAAPAARADWRAGAAAARFAHGPEAARRVTPLGSARITIAGPALAVLVEPLESADAVGRLDAGDRFARRIVIENVGDATARLGRLSLADPRAAAAAFVCSAFRFETRALRADGEGCAQEVDFAGAPLEPGGRASLGVSGRINEIGAPGSPLRAPLRLEPPAAGAAPARVSDTAVTIATRPATPPELTLARLEDDAGGALFDWTPPEGARGVDALPPTEIGATFRARAVFRLPEGTPAAALALRMQLLRRNGAPVEMDRPIVRVIAASLSKDRDDMRLTADQLGLNEIGPGDRADVARAAVVSRDADGWARLRLPLGALEFAGARDGAGEARLVFEALISVEDAPEVSRGRVLAAQALMIVGDRDGAEVAVIGAPIAFGRIAEPIIELAALNDDPDGAAPPGARVVFEALACNRGDAPAYALELAGAPPAGYAFDPDRAPSYVYADRFATRGARRYGDVRISGRRAEAVPAGPSAAVRPGDCVLFATPTLFTDPDAAAGASPPTAAFAVAGYQGRPGAARPGRRYRGSGGASPVRIAELIVAAPERVDAAPGARIDYPFGVSAPSVLEPARLSLRLGGPDADGWRIFRDADGDGVIGAGDSPWVDGATLRPGAQARFVARARAPQAAPAGWRSSVVVKAEGVTPSGRRLTGARELAAVRNAPRTGEMRASRLMAVDRDCDGALADESAQDAAFEPVKSAAPGECVVMRLSFRNDGATPVERVVIEDRLVAGAALVADSARFAATPAGLVGGGVRVTDEAAGARGRALSFRFVGALSPGLEGVVEYRVRLGG